jgi:magnesium-transporting ATPase (P-type)
VAFTVLVVAQLFNALNARSMHASAFHHPFGNIRLLAAIGLSLTLQVLVVHLPFLNSAFGTVPLSLADWLACVAIASVVLWADELRKLVSRRRRAATTT